MEILASKNEKLIKAIIHGFQGVSFSSAQKLIRLGKVKVNGKRVKENVTVLAGDKIETFVTAPSKPKVEILYEDANVIVVFKPAGLECATRDKSSSNTYSLQELFPDKEIYVVHRLDRLTEGIVILAKNKDTANVFDGFFKNGNITKKYMAVVHGNISIGLYTAYLTKNASKSVVQISNTPTTDAKKIITEIQNVTPLRDDGYNLVSIILHTGRTHQIRAHLSHLHAPVAGDSKYGDGLYPASTSYTSGYMLTACDITLNGLTGNLQNLNALHLTHEPSWLQELNIN